MALIRRNTDLRPGGRNPGRVFCFARLTMSAQIIQFRDYQNPRDIERLHQQQSLEQFAAEVWFAAVNPSGIVPTHWPFTDKPEKDPA